MIPARAKVYVATRPVDFRKGPDGLVALVRDTGDRKRGTRTRLWDVPEED